MNGVEKLFSEVINDIYRDIGRFNYAGFIEKLIICILIFIAAKLIEKLSSWFIDRVFNPRNKLYLDEKRTITLRSVTKSFVRYAIYFLALYFIIGQFTNKTGAILTGAGILGLAVGFGAQNLVRDVITGFFILLENQFAVGEFVKIGNFQGIVEELGLRVTKLRDWGGELHVIPNGQIKEVTNYNRGSMRALVEVGIAFEEDIDRVMELMKRVCDNISGEMKDVIVEGPEVVGVVALNQSEVVIRVIAKTKPMEQWAVERELRRRLKNAFDRENIVIPYPKSIMVTPGEGPSKGKIQSFNNDGEPGGSE